MFSFAVDDIPPLPPILVHVSPPILEKTPTKNQDRSWLVSSPLNQEHREAPLQVPTDISFIPKMREVRMVDSKVKLEVPTEDDDIIILDDSDSPKKTRQKVRDCNNVNKHDETTQELCSYQREIVTRHDYKTLAEDEFLNDNIINFYLTWLYENLSDKYKEIVHIYSSHFYTRLKSKKRGKNEKSDKSKQEQAYEKVKGWTKKLDIFEKRMLVFPICEESHWYLVIVCNPGHVLSQSREKDFDSKRAYQQKYGETRGFNPFIMVLDSLGGSHSTAVSKIRSYMMFEHLDKRKIPKNFGKEKMSEKHPPIPLQPNSCDCGLFLLHYIELIFKDPDVFLGAMLPDLSKWFNTTDIDFKREDIAMLIQKITNEDNNVHLTGKNIKFPKIKFPARRKKDGKDGAINVDDLEDVPLSKRRADPRLKKGSKGQPTTVTIREPGSLGELLAAKEQILEQLKGGRSARFKGNYKEVKDEPPSRHSTPPASPEVKSPESPRPEVNEIVQDGPRSLFDSQPRKKISFEIKKEIHAPKSPDIDDFLKSSRKEDDFVKSSRKEKISSFPSLDEFSRSSSRNGSSSWESVRGDKSRHSSRDSNGKNLDRRFTLKRNNEATNPLNVRKRKRDENGQNKPVKSSKEMYDMLMKSTGKTRSPRKTY